MDVGSSGNCIYCAASSDFTDEHVFPAGLGGDDGNYLLKEGVCGNCNTKIFSCFEATLMRRSIIGLARAINQPLSRGGKNSTYDPIESNIIDGDGRQLESAYNKGFMAEVLPQIIYNGPTMDTAAPDKKSLYSFIEALIGTLQEESFCLVEKNPAKSKRKFSVSVYRAGQEGYEPSSKEGTDKVPKNCIWLQYQSSIAKDGAALSPRLFQKPKGQLVLKASDTSKISEMLVAIKKTLLNILKDSTQQDEQEHKTPLITTTCLGWSNDCDRAIAKIGINFIAFQEGLDLARHSSLNLIKEFILNGNPVRNSRFLIDEKVKSQVFGEVPEGNHCVALSTCKGSDGSLSAVISILFYGATGITMSLGDCEKFSNKLDFNYYLVDYKNNLISPFEFLDYQKRHNKHFSELLSQIYIDKFPKVIIRPLSN